MLTDRMIDNRLRMLEKLEADKKILEEKIDAIKQDIQADLENREVSCITTKQFSVRWTCVTSERFNSKKLKEDNAALFASYSCPVSYRRFSYSRCS